MQLLSADKSEKSCKNCRKKCCKYISGRSIMKKSINAWSVDSKTGFEEMFQQIKAAGFDGIELNVDAEEGKSAHSLTLSTTDEELAAVKALSEKYQLPVVSKIGRAHV